MNRVPLPELQIRAWLSGWTIALVSWLLVFGSLRSPLVLLAQDRSPPHDDVQSLEISPLEIRLRGRLQHQQILVTAVTSAGTRIDVTHHCQISMDDPSLVSVDGTVLRASGEGTTQLVVRYGSAVARAAVTTGQLDSPPPVHFANDIVPLFSKLGCNSGGCHGKQSGQNGFKLSVFGFDPRSDYNALVKEARGRRVFPGDPGHSLLVMKATGQIAHGGGCRSEPGSSDAELLTEWIRQGMPWGDDQAPSVQRLIVQPAERVMQPARDQQVLLTALFSDGTRRDVTAAAAYTSNAQMVADVDQAGIIRTGTVAGEAAITVNYMGHVGVVRIVVPRRDAPADYPRLPVNNQIDNLVWEKLKKLGIVPSPPADEAAFLRRVYLHSIGTLPTSDEVRRFLQDDRADKRQRLIDEVLKREEFADYWALKWADILLVNQASLGERGAYEFHRWLRRQFARNRPYDQWTRELLTATGNSARYGPVNFFRALRTPEDLTKSVSQAFLGIRMDCAQCHHHPFEKWGQADFYGMAGFFNGLQRKPQGAGRELIFHAGHQTSKLPLTGQPVATRPPDGPLPADLADRDPRVYLAHWLTERHNPYFATLVANRLWKHFLGRGLVEPEDDLRSTNPASNEPLLAYLADQVVDQDFDLKAVMRLIMNSRVYQLSSVPNRTNVDDQQNFSRFLVKRMPAEVLLDAICHVTGTPEHFVGMPPGTRAIELWDNRMPSYFLDTFGRSLRESPCECGKSSEPTMAQALHLMNAPEIDAKICNPSGRVARLLEADGQPDQLVEELCLTALSRPPRETEVQVARRLFSNQSRREAAEDFLWTLLNSYDFLFIQ